MMEDSRNHPLAVGDVVQLRSGGLLMTVHEDSVDGQVLCMWFERRSMGTFGFSDTTQTLESRRFPRPMLEKVR